ncbi:glutamic-type intramembrane protease PrsW [Halobacillus sp. ACCC02827]|uniref:glutamic-type intramembrane protease PrsW n=1 Tax=Bacillaceae TaxID=186817 RepID=UPI0002A4E84E|nr:MULTISPECIES: glutamic-type intramembrane protease PrsW [Bacillaceae]ELK45358.1 protease PrsW [Halobacillus sp. BAB-2008]QHT46891.1 intramembrane metalloprotease PrsW [Bacillus sp. SB49]WJE14114.1 glutamic-type intramembrane protease PrsW [Halobacillus sp. ACCC02827]
MAILTAAISPAVAIMTFIYLSKRIELEPLPLIFRMFVIGVIMVFPLMFIQYAFQAEGVFQEPFLKSFFLAGLLEEFFKWFFLLFVAYRHSDFDHHYDGIIYGVAISLGFATIENVIYLFANGIEIAVLRAVFPVSSHGLFGIMMGFYMGKAKFAGEYSNRYMYIALFIPVMLHTIYDYIITIKGDSWMYWITPFIVILWIISFRHIRVANQHHTSYPEIDH